MESNRPGVLRPEELAGVEFTRKSFQNPQGIPNVGLCEPEVTMHRIQNRSGIL